MNKLATLRGLPLWLSFSTAGCEGTCFPATLSKALSRLCLVYPLVSLDISGQWPVFHTDASPNEVSVCAAVYTPASRFGQEPAEESYPVLISQDAVNAGM